MIHVENEYIDWLFNLMCADDRFRIKSYRNMLLTLYYREFTWVIPNDVNRAEEGICLRYRFASYSGYTPENTILNYIPKPCSILEMMAALAIRCEENIMDDPQIGDRTTQWFWSMVRSLGLLDMCDNNFNQSVVDSVLTAFINRRYKATGEGGLFTIKNCTSDLRDVEIWIQLCWYLDLMEGY